MARGLKPAKRVEVEYEPLGNQAEIKLLPVGGL